jgi:hypothetical protein
MVGKTEKKTDPSDNEDNHEFWKPKKWALGILNDPDTDEVPGMLAFYDSPSKIKIEAMLTEYQQAQFFFSPKSLAGKSL